MHHNITFQKGANCVVAGHLRGNHDSTILIDGADTSVTAENISMGIGSYFKTEANTLILREGSLSINESIEFDPALSGKIVLESGRFEKKAEGPVTNAEESQISIGDQMQIQSGIITGKDNETRLDPQGNATRAEGATIIRRFTEKYESQ